VLGAVTAATGAAGAMVVEFDRALVSYNTDALVTNRPSVRAPTVDANPRDPFGGRAVNLLVIGSDSREGSNQAIGGGSSRSMRSDSTVIVHISADRSRVEVVSIPRDTLVDIPPCTLSNGVTTSSGHTKFNAAFSYGATQGENVGDAAACTIQTVESVTGVRIDAFVVVDFAGFVDVIDSIGHVTMCVDQAMRSTDAKLDIEAGCQDFDGTTALAYARARKGEGMPEGSDLARIGRQQALGAAVLRRVADMTLLTSLPDLYRVATASARAVTTSDNLGSAADLAGFAFALRSTPLDHIEFITAPNVSAGDGANVVFAPGIETLWDAIAEDRRPPSASASPAASVQTGATQPKATQPKATPSQTLASRD
jgi:LCP family protein required for cell wall assembly